MKKLWRIFIVHWFKIYFLYIDYPAHRKSRSYIHTPHSTARTQFNTSIWSELYILNYIYIEVGPKISNSFKFTTAIRHTENQGPISAIRTPRTKRK